MSNNKIIQIADSLVSAYINMTRIMVGEHIQVKSTDYKHFLQVALEHPEESFDPCIYIKAAFGRRWWRRGREGVTLFSLRPPPFLLSYGWIEAEYQRILRRGEDGSTQRKRYLVGAEKSKDNLKRLGYSLDKISPECLYTMYVSGVVSVYLLVQIPKYGTWLREQVVAGEIEEKELDLFVVVKRAFIAEGLLNEEE